MRFRAYNLLNMRSYFISLNFGAGVSILMYFNDLNTYNFIRWELFLLIYFLNSFSSRYCKTIFFFNRIIVIQRDIWTVWLLSCCGKACFTCESSLPIYSHCPLVIHEGVIASICSSSYTYLPDQSFIENFLLQSLVKHEVDDYLYYFLDLNPLEFKYKLHQLQFWSNGFCYWYTVINNFFIIQTYYFKG